MIIISMRPDEIMRSRWLRQLERSIPAVDLEDVNALLEDPQADRQFAAEFSQASYTCMLEQDRAVGDYVARLPGRVAFSYQDRERLISIIQELTKKKEYKQETMHLAGNLADRYLSLILARGQPVPNLYTLGATVMLMAAKLEQPVSPSFNRMLALLPSSEQKRVKKQDLVNLEEKILVTLNFSLHNPGPIPFIERY